MKRLISVSLISLMLGFVIANAQMYTNKPDSIYHRHRGMMGDNGKNFFMQHRMPNVMHMQNRDMASSVMQMKPYIRIVKRLPDMQKELSLTDVQVEKLIDLQTGYMKQKADLKADLTKKELKLKNLLHNNASSKEVSEQLKSCAASMADIGVAAYETANKMKSVLNDSQNKQLDEILSKHRAGKQFGHCIKSDND